MNRNCDIFITDKRTKYTITGYAKLLKYKKNTYCSEGNKAY